MGTQVLLLTIPKVFFSNIIWFAIIIPLLIAIYLLKRKHPPPPRKPSKFFTKHKESIRKISDACIILLVVLMLLSFFDISRFFLDEPEYHGQRPILDVSVQQLIRSTRQLVRSAFLSVFTMLWGLCAFWIGLLSYFHKDLTKRKRILLLIICLLPAVFTALNLATGPSDIRWDIIKSGLGSLTLCWIFNGPAIITGKHFPLVFHNILRKLHLVSGDFPA